jgi:hypothetical protein
VFAGLGLGEASVTVLERTSAPPYGSSPADIVLCDIPDAQPVRLFCKYASPGDHQRYGHRGGLSRETYVYRRLLPTPGAPEAVHYYGSHVGPDGRPWLILEYLERGERLVWTAEPKFMYAAARWIGAFHASQEARSDPHPIGTLGIYDADYYLGWARRTHRYAAPLRDEHPWISQVCDRARELLHPLLIAPHTVIHGEYYPKNIMIQDARVYPVDWESTAIGPGEIDLASLTERWPPEITGRCQHEYADARWPDGAPDRFDDALLAARIYLHFRWLGDQPASTIEDSLRWRFSDLHTLAETAGPRSGPDHHSRQ